MSDAIQNYFPYLTAVTLGLGLLLFLVSLRFFRRSRTDVYWRRRRDAGQRGWRIFVLSFALFLIGGLSCLVTAFVYLDASDEDGPPKVTVQDSASAPTTAPALDASPPPTDEITPAPTTPDGQVPVDSTPATPVIVIITATPAYTPTETPFPTFTPRVTPPVSHVTPRPDASLRITALDSDISDALTPVNPRSTFATGINRIYLFVEFQGMTEGVLWKRHLYHDGKLIDGGAYLWGLETSGTTYFFFGNDSGFVSGSYEIRLHINDEPAPAASAAFVITDTP